MSKYNLRDVSLRLIPVIFGMALIYGYNCSTFLAKSSVDAYDCFLISDGIAIPIVFALICWSASLVGQLVWPSILWNGIVVPVFITITTDYLSKHNGLFGTAWASASFIMNPKVEYLSVGFLLLIALIAALSGSCFVYFANREKKWSIYAIGCITLLFVEIVFLSSKMSIAGMNLEVKASSQWAGRVYEAERNKENGKTHKYSQPLGPLPVPPKQQ